MRESLWKLILAGTLAAVAVAAGLMTRGDSPASAATVICNPATNHCYESVTVPAGITWPAARAAAAAMTNNGFPGHLVTITSAAENGFLIANGLATPAYWVGGSQPLGLTTPALGWTWVTGEPFVYTNWSAGEPNDFYGPASEQYLEFWSPTGTWNDQNNTFPQGGYIVEYDRPTTGDDCKQDGWRKYAVFKNQGDCVSWVVTGGRNEPGKNNP